MRKKINIFLKTLSWRMSIRLIFILFFSFIHLVGVFDFNGFRLCAKQIHTLSNLPLGATYDGKVYWVVDTKTRMLYGYDFETGRSFLSHKLRIAGVRDIDFWNNYIITTYKKYIYKINPINGNIEEKYYVSKLTNPVSLAVLKDVVYIFNKSDKKFYRFDLKKKINYGGVITSLRNIRGMTFHKNKIWAIEKNRLTKQVQAVKINYTTGEVLKFIPLQENVYGITFIDSRLFVSSAHKSFHVDYIEADNYVAISKKEYSFQAKFQLPYLWYKKQFVEERKLKFTFYGFPYNAHQRFTRMKVKPNKIRFSRRSGGESLIRAKFATNEDIKTFEWNTSFKIYDLIYILNKYNIAEYFEKKVIPSYARKYLSIRTTDEKIKKKVKKIVDLWNEKQEGIHPYQMMPFILKENLNNIDEQILFFRQKGVPARKTKMYQIDKKKMIFVLQVFMQPLGWVSITDRYNAKAPKLFPIGNNLIEMIYYDSLDIYPPPEDKRQIEVPYSEDDLKFPNIRVYEYQ